MQTSLNYILLIFSCVMAVSCHNDKDYRSNNKGLLYKIIKENAKGTAVKEKDILVLNLKYYTQKDSLIFNSKDFSAQFRVQVGNADKDGLMQDALKMLKTGDSASFLIPAENFYAKTKKAKVPDFIKPGEQVRFEIKLNDIISPERLQKEYKQYLLKKEAEEKQILQEYIAIEEIHTKPTKSGIYIIKMRSGKGKKAKPGKIVSIHFTGKYINGQVFDSSIDKGKALSFVLGNKNAIPAWNEAIATMRVGDKIKLIAPSQNAYGSEGIKDYVPPFTTLIYEIKLIDVQ